jgi:hypothetical protein
MPLSVPIVPLFQKCDSCRIYGWILHLPGDFPAAAMNYSAKALGCGFSYFSS